MLYERWQQIAQDRRNEAALYEVASGRTWTFGQLAQTTDTPLCDSPGLVCPQGHSAEFILAVLRAWRAHAAVCPLEPLERPPPVELPPTPCRHLKTTSATTSAPKTIAFTDSQLAADADNIVATMGLRPDWPNLGAISLAHSYGFSNLVLPLLLHGIPLILAPSPLPLVVCAAAKPHRDITLAGVPALWNAWHEGGALGDNIRLAICAGAPLPLSVEQAVFASTGIKIHNFYGSSECGGIAYDTAVTPRADESFAGQPMKNVSLELGADGTLVVRSAAVGQTYWPMPTDALAGGRFQTSDLVELKDGSIYLRGRVGDQINVAGRKVSPAAIEQVLRECEAVTDCLVFGVPSRDTDRTDLIVACVAVRRSITAKELKAFLLQKLAGWQVPREWWFVKSLETNQRGKISRAQWRAKFLEMRVRKAGPK